MDIFITKTTLFEASAVPHASESMYLVMYLFTLWPVFFSVNCEENNAVMQKKFFFQIVAKKVLFLTKKLSKTPIAVI